jgi:predicted cobalt transporter CbtA
MQHLARSFLVIVILVLALDLFATLPALAAQDALDSGAWDLARHVRVAVGTRVEASSGNLPLLMGAIVLLAALSASSGSRKKDRW